MADHEHAPEDESSPAPDVTGHQALGPEADSPALAATAARAAAHVRAGAPPPPAGRGGRAMLARRAVALQHTVGNAGARRVLARYTEYRVMPRGESVGAVARWLRERVHPVAGRDLIGVLTGRRLFVFTAEAEPRLIDNFPRGEIEGLYTGVWRYKRDEHHYNLLVDDVERRDHWSYTLYANVPSRPESLVGDVLQREFMAIFPQPPGELYLAFPEGEVSETEPPLEDQPPEEAPPDPNWGTAAARAARVRIEAEQAAGGQPPPDRIVPWTRDGRWYVNVWVGGDHRPLELNHDEATDRLVERIRDATRRMREAADPARSVRVEGGATGEPRIDTRVRSGEIPVPPGVQVDPTGGRRPNAPAFPARIVSHGPEGQMGNQRHESTVTGATVNFTMDLDYAAVTSGFWEEFGARWQLIAYKWELYDITNVQLPTSAPAGARSTDEVAERIRAVEAALQPGMPAAERLEVERRLTGLEAELSSGIVRDMGRDVGDMWEDTVADYESGWGFIPAYSALIAISDIVQLVGAPVSGGFSLLASAMADKSIGFGREGVFLLRCFAQPVITDDDIARIEAEGLQPIIRAPSVAHLPIRVTPINRRATDVNDAELRALDELRQQEREADPFDTASAHERVQAAEAAMGDNNVEAIDRAIASARTELGRIEAWREAEHQDTPLASRDPALRIWHAMLDIGGVRVSEAEERLNETIRQLQDVRRRVSEFGMAGTTGRAFRPRITLVSEVDGRVYPIVANLVEESGSSEGARAWKLVDVSSDETKAEYRGTGSTHNAAINAAFERFRLDCEYGRGTIAVRLPLEQLRQATQEDIRVPGLLVAQPGTGRRFIGRLGHLAIAAEVAALFIAGPVGIAIGVVGGLAGAAVAVHDLARRAERGQLLSLEAGLDVLAVIGSLALMGGAAARLRQAANLSRRARWVGDKLHVIGVGLMYGQVVVIPVSLYGELERIEREEQRELEQAGERGTTANVDRARYRARRLEALARAIKSGAVTVRMAQMAADPEAGWNPLRTRPGQTGPTQTREADAPLRPMALLRNRLREIATVLRRRGVTKAERWDVIRALRAPNKEPRGALEGFLPRGVVAENQRAVRSVRDQLTASNPDVVVGIERGGSLLADILAAGDASLVPKVRRMPMRRPPERPDGTTPSKFDAPAMTAQFDALVAEGARKIAIVDYYMGGPTARELSQMLRERLANDPAYAGVTIEVLWIRETFGFTEAGGTTVGPLQGRPRPGQQGYGRYSQTAQPVTLALGDDMTIVNNESGAPLHIFDDAGNVTRTIRPQPGQTTRDILIDLLNAPAE